MFSPRLLSTAIVAALAAGNSHASDYSNTVFFGDSLSDAGTYANEAPLAGIFPIAGKFTTNPGPVWSELVTEAYGFTAAPANQGGYIYAAGGARVDTQPGYPDSPLVPFIQTAPSVADQISAHLSRNGGRADPGTLYNFWAGANDIFAFQDGGASYSALPAEQVAERLSAQIARLQNAGGRYIVVSNVPNIGNTPAAATSGTEAESTALSQAFNNALFTSLREQGIAVVAIDAYGMTEQIIADPARFGISNTTGVACASAPTSLVCGPGDYSSGSEYTYLYADSVHPTTQVHAIQAAYVLSVLAAPQQFGLLADSALSSRRLLHEQLRTQTEAGASQRQQSGRNVWLVAQLGEYERDAGRNDPGSDDNNRNLMAGVDWQLNSQWVVGTALGFSQRDGDYSGDRGDYEQDELSLSLLSHWQGEHAYLLGSLTYGQLDNDSQRDIQLASARFTAHGDSDGYNTSVYLETGYLMGQGNGFRHGPLLALHSQHLRLEDFTEEGAGVLNLGVAEQERHSHLLSAGWQLRYRWHNLETSARLSADRELEDNEHSLTLSTLSIPQALPYSLPVSSADRDGFSAQLGLQGELASGVNFTLGALSQFGRDDEDSWQLYGGLSLAF